MGKETYGREDFLGPWAQGLIWAIALPGLLLLAHGKLYDRRETVTVFYKPETPTEAGVLGMLLLSLGGTILLYTTVAVPPVLPVVGHYGFGAGSLLWKRRFAPERAPALGPD